MSPISVSVEPFLLLCGLFCRQSLELHITGRIDAEPYPIPLDPLDVDPDIWADLQHFAFLVGQDQQGHLQV